ncbi:hypothetical protein PDJAM_G00226320 [Pangasius djambal]|uniref:Uncharacterized protein n=1 Tax=Pangasius djambal TaxID=1691987 RepID=A0ACC5YD52_9TELE|nr:hypothetical protein [Pangasius djambal]
MRRTCAEIQKFFLRLNEARSRETAVCCFSPVTEEERMDKQADKNPKRQRDPLEENVPASNELEAVLKRRRLAAGGVENHNPEQRAVRSPARPRRVESEVKPDTPAIASVRLRVQQLTQRRDGGAALVQRCMSDPGAESPSSALLRDVCHIGEGEFVSRLERFKTPTPDSSPGPATPSTRQLSSFVHNMQQQLNAAATPSSKEAPEFSGEDVGVNDPPLTSLELEAVLKRRRLAAGGVENHNPEQRAVRSPARPRRVESEVKPDTPAIASVRLRVQQLTQRRDGGAALVQRCMSDPGAESPSSALLRDVCHIGEGEFVSRLERFKTPTPDSSPGPATPSTRQLSSFVHNMQQQLNAAATPSSKEASREGEFVSRLERFKTPTPDSSPGPATPSTRQLSSFVHNMQQQLNAAATPSSKEASRMRQAREDELKSLRVQPLTENMWLKRSFSDPSLAEDDSSIDLKESECSLNFSGVNETMGDSFSATSTFTAETQPPATALCPPDSVARPHEGMSTSALIDKMFEDVLQAADREEEEGKEEEGKEEEGKEEEEEEEEERGNDSSVSESREEADVETAETEPKLESPSPSLGGDAEACDGDQKECENGNDEEEVAGEREESAVCNEEDFLSLPPSCVLSPLSKSVEAVVTPMAREDELKSLRVQPLTENMWLKRSFSDPSLAEDDSSIDLKESECSLNFSGVNETMGDSFSATSTFTAETQPPATALCPPDSVARPHEGMSTSALIDKMFEDVLQAADREEEEGKEEEGKEEEERGNDSSVSESREEADVETAETEPKLESPSPSLGGDAEACDGEQKECENGNDEGEVAGEREESAVCNEEDFLSLPPSCVLSPLSKSVEAVVTPMRLTATAPPPMVPCGPAEGVATPPAAPLYSIDAYRSQRKNPPPSSQSVTPGLQKQRAEKSRIKPAVNTKETIKRKNPPPSSQSVTPGLQKQRAEKSRIKPAVNTKETIKALSDEASKLQTVITQTLQALSCCSDEEHGKGSLQEAEAEKLLLVSSEKRAALLAEISRLREGGAGREPDPRPDRLQPCRGTLSINNIQLPLKVEFVCSARTARPTHYFFILIRYGACNIVATPLATAADAENGDTITFPTSITLQDIRSHFEIDVEVYSLCNSAANSSSANVQQHRTSTRAKATPKKLLSSIKKSNPCSTCLMALMTLYLLLCNLSLFIFTAAGASSALDPQRSSNFSLVGSHKVTLSSLGQSKFLLDKMKFEGKIRRLLGDEFQEKVPFLSPLEGHIYLRLHSESHSNVQHQGFLTMFEDVSGFGAWQRLFFKLEGGILYYWNYPNESSSKPAEGSVSLCGSDSVRPVERDSCARPHTFELVNSRTLQQDQSHTLTKSWFSADTREERADWMEKLNQVLLDLHTWSRRAAGGESDQADISSVTATSRESVL